MTPAPAPARAPSSGNEGSDGTEDVAQGHRIPKLVARPHVLIEEAEADPGKGPTHDPIGGEEFREAVEERRREMDRSEDERA